MCPKLFSPEGLICDEQWQEVDRSKIAPMIVKYKRNIFLDSKKTMNVNLDSKIKVMNISLDNEIKTINIGINSKVKTINIGQGRIKRQWIAILPVKNINQANGIKTMNINLSCEKNSEYDPKQ